LFDLLLWPFFSVVFVAEALNFLSFYEFVLDPKCGNIGMFTRDSELSKAAIDYDSYMMVAWFSDIWI